MLPARLTAKPCLRHYLSLEIVPVCIKMLGNAANVLLLSLLPYFFTRLSGFTAYVRYYLGNKVDYI